MSGLQRLFGRQPDGRPAVVISQLTLTAGAVTAEFVVILLATVVAGAGYQFLAYGETGPIAAYSDIGALAAIFYVLPFLSQGCHDVPAYVAGRRGFRYVLLRWHCSLVLLGVVGFLTKSTGNISRGWVIGLYVLGLLSLCLLNWLTRRFIECGVAQRRIGPRRVMLVGTSADIEEFWKRHRPAVLADQIVSIVRLPGLSDQAFEAAFHDALAGAPTHARPFGIDSVVILSGHLTPRLVKICVDTLSVLPVSIHLDTGPILDNVRSTEIERIGGIAAVMLARKPLDAWQSALKRLFDIVVAFAGLIALFPLFVIVALLIKLDSRGPVLFLQRRRGYNHHEFRILKFRSMTTLDDGDRIEQAKVGDVRITRVGRLLRRFNFDELPQLWNVLIGDMSIVGPRPHAVAHDKQFETRIENYPRRLNVKPGITGWAQVNGLRGETDTDEKMSQRVEHDLYYIDHWSLWLDVKIVLMTVFSPRAFANAR